MVPAKLVTLRLPARVRVPLTLSRSLVAADLLSFTQLVQPAERVRLLPTVRTPMLFVELPAMRRLPAAMVVAP